jgi:fumarylpyruvate hydrolase
METTGEIRSGLIQLQVNGEVRQTGDISDMIWNTSEVISHISKAWELQPGDLIYTGTPAGVGPVKTGDVLTAQAVKVGSFSIRIV